MSFVKSALAAIALAGLGTVGASGAALAGTWYVNANACPDLREDRRDSQRWSGFGDLYEDRQDRRVISCPEHAWEYIPDRNERYYGAERGSGARLGTPGTVYLDHHGRFFRRTFFGEYHQIHVVIHHGRSGRGHYGNRDHHGYRGQHGNRYGHHY